MRGPKPKRKEVLWSSEFAYAVGLMASDGCLSPDGRHLALVSKDLEQTENLKSAFCISANIGFSYTGSGEGRRRYYRIQWGDVLLYKFLLSIGLTPNKSLTLGKLNIPDAYFFDYLRGSFDGDGCFYSYFDPRWKNSFLFYLALTSGNKEQLIWVQETVLRLINHQGKITLHLKRGATNPYYQLRYAKKGTGFLLKELYASPASICLSRKRLKIEQGLGIVGLSLPQDL